MYLCTWCSTLFLRIKRVSSPPRVPSLPQPHSLSQLSALSSSTELDHPWRFASRIFVYSVRSKVKTLTLPPLAPSPSSLSLSHNVSLTQLFAGDATIGCLLPSSPPTLLVTSPFSWVSHTSSYIIPASV